MNDTETTLKPEAEAALEAILASGRTVDERVRAAERLSTMEAPGVVVPLAGLLDGAELPAPVLAAARKALDAQKPARVLGDELATAEGDDDKAILLRLIARWGSAEQFASVEPYTRDASPKVREEAFLTAATLGQARAAELLTTCLGQEQDAGVRSACVQGLVDAVGDTARSTLESHRKVESDPLVQQALESALRRLGS